MATWDLSTPTGSEAISNGDNRFREVKTAIQDSLQGPGGEGTESIFPGPDPLSNPVYRYRGEYGGNAALPTAGSRGLYFNTDRQTMLRDTTGIGWLDVGTNFVAGTVMLFAQASAPTGWVKLTTVNDKALRIVSGSTGGTTGGSLDLSGGVTHTHSVLSHTHVISEAAIEHKHEQSVLENGGGTIAVATAVNGMGNAAGNPQAVGTFGGTGNVNDSYNFHLTSDMKAYAGGSTDGTALTSESSSPVIAYMDVIQASKS